MVRLGRRTDYDFSKHVHTCKKITDGDISLQIDSLQVGDSLNGAIHFVNTPFGMSVYGDYGNWVFNRRFIPNHKGENVSDHYWIEKLQLHAQDLEFVGLDKSLNKIHLTELMENLADYGLSQEEDERAMWWIEELIECIENENWDSYIATAYDDMPEFLSVEDVPMYRLIPGRLKVVFDAFEEICERLKSKHDVAQLPKEMPISDINVVLGTPVCVKANIKYVTLKGKTSDGSEK